MRFPSFRCAPYSFDSRKLSDSGVQATIFDKRLSVCKEDLGIAYFEAEVLTQSDYYPFGASLPVRQRSAGTEGYRYGFNTQEKDDEIYGTGNSYSAEFWQYDSRLGRRWNIDPVRKVFESPYAAFGNNPILLIERKGADTTSATSAASKFIQDAVSPTTDVNRNWLGRFLTGQKTKTITNDKYQPKIAEIVNKAANDPNVCLTFTTDGTGLNVEGAAGAMKKTRENSYTVYFDPNADVRSIGTSPVYEEIFHFDNAYSGLANYTLKSGNWGIWDNSQLLDEEARSKYQVISHIRGINSTFRVRLGNGSYADTHTDFGYMLFKSMKQEHIKTFISTGSGTLHSYDIWGFGPSSLGPTGETLPVSIPAQGSYDFLTR